MELWSGITASAGIATGDCMCVHIFCCQFEITIKYSICSILENPAFHLLLIIFQMVQNDEIELHLRVKYFIARWFILYLTFLNITLFHCWFTRRLERDLIVCYTVHKNDRSGARWRIFWAASDEKLAPVHGPALKIGVSQFLFIVTAHSQVSKW